MNAFDALRRDLRQAWRQFGRAPGLSAVAVLVLALGIGANTAVIAVLDGILFRPPPGVRDADGLFTVRSRIVAPQPGRLGTRSLTYAEFLALREQTTGLAETAAWTDASTVGRGLAMRTSDGVELVEAELVTSAFFNVLRTPMTVGSPFQPADDRPGDPVLHVVIGYGFWNERMGGAADAIGRTLTLNGYPFTIIGVAPERFHGAEGDEDPVAMWLPVAAYPLLFPDAPPLLESGRIFNAITRLASGVTPERAQAAAEAASVRMAAGPDTDPNEPRRLTLLPYRGLGMEDGAEIMSIVGAAGGLIGGVILLIACLNVSALLLGRSLKRRREVAVRLALGASRATLVRQMLTESVMLGLAAGAFGILLATWALDAIGVRLFTFPVELSPRPVTLAAAVFVAAGTGLLFGTMPALHATRTAVFTALKDSVAGGDPRAVRLRGWFAIAQLALSLPLLAAAGLLIADVFLSVRAESAIPQPERLLSVTLDLRQGRYPAARVDAMLTEARARIAALPGVQEAAFARTDPLLDTFSGRIQLPPDIAAATGRPFQVVELKGVDPEYFGIVGLPILRGRAIDASDAPGGLPAVVIGEDFAQLLWPGQDPIGRTLTYVQRRDVTTVLTIVGVAPNTLARWNCRADNCAATEPVVLYGSRRQFPDTTVATLLARTTGPAAASAGPIRQALTAVDPQLVIAQTSVLAERMRETRSELTNASAGASGIGLLALFLACVGVYAVIAFGVAERTREIGVRMALGASRGQVVRLFVRRGLRLALVGLGIGVPLTFATVQLLGAGMFGLETFSMTKVAALAAVGLTLVGIATLSSWLPARKSAGVDPVAVLRSE